MKRVCLYGIGRACDQYRIMRYEWLTDRDVTVTNMKTQARLMQECYPSIGAVFAIDNRPGLVYEAKQVFRNPSIESCVIFKDTLEREGLRVL